MPDVVTQSLAEIKSRLFEIADQVANTDLPLEEALTLYEEAVNLGLHATNLLEDDITEEELAEVSEESAEESAAGEQPQASDETVPTPSGEIEDLSRSSE